MTIAIGTKVRVHHETGIIEDGIVVGASTEPITKVRSLSIHFADDTHFTVAEFRATPISPELRVHDWAAKHLAAEPDVTSARAVETGGGCMAVEVTTSDSTYLVSFSRRMTGEGRDAAWTADIDPNNDDAWTTAATAVQAFRAERAADLAFRGGPLGRAGVMDDPPCLCGEYGDHACAL